MRLKTEESGYLDAKKLSALSNNANLGFLHKSSKDHILVKEAKNF